MKNRFASKNRFLGAIAEGKMNTLAIVLIIALVCMATAFQAGLKTRVNVNSKLQMALADYKEELAATAAAIAAPGKSFACAE